MGYDFHVKRPAGGGAGGGDNGPGQPPAPKAAPQGGGAALNDVGIVDRAVLFGDDMRLSQIPTETAAPAARPMVTFVDPMGRAFGLNERLLSMHLLLLGAIGSGKTNVFNFIIESLLQRMGDSDVMLIFDTKGDFMRKFCQVQAAVDPWDPWAPRTNRKSQQHILIGNSEEYNDISYSWDIFGEMRQDGTFTRQSELAAKEIAKQLFEGRESETQPFFVQAASDLTAKAMIHLMRKAKKAHREQDLKTSELVDFLQNADIKKLDAMIKDPDNPDFASAQFYIGDPSKAITPQALGVLGYISAMVNDLFVGVFAEDRQAGSIAMKDFIRQKGKRVLFLEYDLKSGEVLTPMYRLLFDLALKEALGGREQKRGSTYLIIDEFKLLPNLMHITDALNYGRSLGVKVFAGLQSVNQLYQIYGEDKGKVLMAGFMNSFCFQTFDLDSRRFIMDRFGDTYENISFQSRLQSMSVQREGHVVEDWDVLNLGVGEAFVNLVHHKPFRFQFSDFEKPHSVL